MEADFPVSMFERKPEFEEVFNRYEAWWNRAIVDRPLVSMTFPRPKAEQRSPPLSGRRSVRERWLDTDYVVACAETRLHNIEHFADSLPVAWPNLGPEVFSAFYGCPLEYAEDTAWSRPILSDLSETSVTQLRPDPDSIYFRKVLEITDALIEAGREKFLVGYTDLHPGGDALAALRGPQELLIDTIEYPAEIRRLCDRITEDFLRVYDVFHDRLRAAGMPSTTWLPATCRGRFHVPSNDFSCMISEEAFEDLFLPGIRRECRHMDRCIYHLDGPGALRHLDRILDAPEIDAVQWVPGAGRDYWSDWIDVYRKIQNRGKALQLLSVPAGDLEHLFATLAPEGVWIASVGGISNRMEADAVLRKIARWTRRRG